jgi:hypothetical protein
MLRCGTTSLLLVLAILISPLSCRAADVTLDGAVVPKATSIMSIPVDVTEFREGGSECPVLLPGCPKPRVCVTAPAPIAPLDAQLAGAPPARFTVGVEDGRSFGRCVILSLDTSGAGSKRRYLYCLRCEGVTAP